MYSNSDLDTAINVYGDDIEVDYRGYEVTPENFIRILTGRHDKSVPRSKRLLSDENSNVFLYMTGHGGEGFLKFQDSEIISSEELGDSKLPSSAPLQSPLSPDLSSVSICITPHNYATLLSFFSSFSFFEARYYSTVALYACHVKVASSRVDSIAWH